MSGKDKNDVVFWLPNFPEIMDSFLVALIQKDKYNVKIFSLSPMPKEREKMYSDTKISQMCCIESWNEEIPLEEFFTRNMELYQNAIHVFGGFLGKVGECLKIYREKYKGRNAVILTEKPSILPHRNKFVNFFLTILKKLRMRQLYSNAYKKNASAICAVLVTGMKGVAQLKSYGVTESKLFDFMYSHLDEDVTQKTNKCGDIIKFVYVGRFNYQNRGLDNLMYAFDNVNAINWSLDLVGGYGEDSAEIIQWAEKTASVSYVGAWKSNEVIKNLQNYDVSVNPTKVDGWRVQINQAIMAGIATITTEEAISDELVVQAKCGKVVNAFNKNELLNAVNFALENPDIVNEWKENAFTYSSNITNERLADYFINIIEYVITNTGEKPKCPWIN